LLIAELTFLRLLTRAYVSDSEQAGEEPETEAAEEEPQSQGQTMPGVTPQFSIPGLGGSQTSSMAPPPPSSNIMSSRPFIVFYITAATISPPEKAI